MDWEIKQRLYETFVRLRCWVDAVPYVIPPLREKSTSDAFSDKIVRELEAVMHREKFSYQNGKTLLPTKYVVFISEEENSAWVGRKREGLEKKLLNHVGSTIRPASDQATLMPQNYEVKIMVDKQLEKDRIKVVHFWEERNPNIQICVNSKENYTGRTHSGETTRIFPKTDFDTFGGEEITIVRSNSQRLFGIEVWRYGRQQEIIPVFLPEVKFGRGSPSMTVEILLKGDAEISRLHATLRKDKGDKFYLHVSGKKPVMVNGQPVFAEQTIPVSIGEELKIGSYSLCLRN